MKKYVLLTVVLAVSANLIAQRGKPSMGDRQLERMKSGLSLSDEQYSRLKEVNEIFQQDLERLRGDTSLTRGKVIGERRALMEKHDNAIKAILTEQQYNKWSAMHDGSGRRAQTVASRHEMMAELKKVAGLSDEQVQKIKAINADMAKDFRKLRSDSTVSGAERPKAVKAIVSNRNGKMKNILTPEQYEKFLAFENEMAQARRRGNTMRNREPRN